MKKITKSEFVSNESKYLYKCPKCGTALEPTDGPDDWDNLDLDRMDCHYCPNCEIMVEYYYSLDCVKYVDDDGNRSNLVLKNRAGTEYVELESVQGAWNFPKVEIAE